MTRSRFSAWCAPVSAALLFSFAACATPVPVGAPAPDRMPPERGSPAGAATRRSPVGPAPLSPALAAQSGVVRWPIKTAEHIDLWLHAFAMISSDSVPMPLYRRGYRDSMTVVKNRAGLFTSLDSNRTVLGKQLRTSNGYVLAQFLTLDVANWDVLRAFGERFLQAGGDVRRASDKGTAERLAPFAAIFPTPEDREWLRLFLAGVDDEQRRFFATEHSRIVRTRAAVITAVDSLWQRVYRPKFDRFLTNTGQRTGDIVLSVPVGGEGRTGLGRDRQTVVVVPFPQRVEDAADVLLVFAHEITGPLVASVVADNTTPAEQRAGAADRVLSVGQVRAGAMLLARIAPELTAPYMRFYLAHVGALEAGAARDASVSETALTLQFAQRFPLPDTIRGALERQIEIVLGGI